MEKLRFGIMCHGTTFAAWEAQCIRSLIASSVAEPALLIVDAAPQSTRIFLEELKEIDRLFYRVYTKVWNRHRTRAYRPVNVDDELRHVPRLPCKVIHKGRHSQYFRPEDVEAITASNLDFILRFGFNIIRGDVLDAAKYGVWSYHHDDELLYRGGPSGYWEIVNGDAATGAILQRLTDRLDGGIILHKGYFKTRRRFTKNRDSVSFGSTDWCVRVCKEIQLGQVEKFSAPPSKTDAPIYRIPTNRQFLAFIFRQARQFTAGVFKWLFFLEIWNVGVCDKPVEEIVKRGRPVSPRWLPRLGGYRFVADPFARAVADRLYVLLEEYSYLSTRGRISVATVPEAYDGGSLAPVIELPTHLAYPYVFEAEGQVYCVPDNYESNGVTLFRAVDFPKAWEQVRTLIEGFPAVDPTIFRHRGRWWLFCTNHTDRPNEKLYGWYAESIHGPWTPHPLNPLKTDVRSARPAGRPFEIDGVLYRPGQDCSQAYGGATTINRVIQLGPTTFEEETVGKVTNEADGPYSVGLHTICPAGDMTIIDGKTWRFSVLAAALKVRRDQIARKREALINNGNS